MTTIERNEIEQSQLEALYDDFQRPPKIDIAKMHAAATKFAKTDQNIDLDNTNVCPCCGFPAVIEELPLCSSRNDFSFNGSGIALYFDFIAFSGVIISVLISISCMYNIFMNYNGTRCRNVPLNLQEKCANDFFNLFSLTNDDGPLDEIRSVLNFVSLVCILFITLFYRRHINKIAMDLDDAVVLASDYSIMVYNIPKEANEEEIKEFFGKDFQNEKVELRKLCIAYKIEPYLNLHKIKQLKESVLTKVLEMEEEGKPLPKSIPPSHQLRLEIGNISKQLDNMEENRASIFNFSGVAIISYNYESQADNVCKTFKATRFQIFLEEIGYHQNKFQKFGQNSLLVKKAPEPGDILWENLDMELKDQYKRKFITNLMTFFILVFGIASLFGLSYAQSEIHKQTEEGSLLGKVIIILFGTISSILIFMINSLLAKVILKFVELEKQPTITDYNISVASKMGIAQFLNTAILTLIINLIIKDQNVTLNQAIWQIGGLNSDVMLIFITNSIVPWLTQIIDFNYFYKLYVRQKIIKQGQNCKYTQNEANQAFEGTTIDLSQKYAQLSKSLMMAFLYAALLPFGVIFTLLAIICTYWTEKYLLLRRYSKPAPTGSAMAEAMVDFYIELILLLYSIGCLIWELINYDSIHYLTWTQLALSTLYYLLPVERFCGCIVDLGIENPTLASYDEQQLTFYDDYDKRNQLLLIMLKQNGLNFIKKPQCLQRSLIRLCITKSMDNQQEREFIQFQNKEISWNEISLLIFLVYISN